MLLQPGRTDTGPLYDSKRSTTWDAMCRGTLNRRITISIFTSTGSRRKFEDRLCPIQEPRQNRHPTPKALPQGYSTRSFLCNSVKDLPLFVKNARDISLFSRCIAI